MQVHRPSKSNYGMHFQTELPMLQWHNRMISVVDRVKISYLMVNTFGKCLGKNFNSCTAPATMQPSSRANTGCDLHIVRSWVLHTDRTRWGQPSCALPRLTASEMKLGSPGDIRYSFQAFVIGRCTAETGWNTTRTLGPSCHNRNARQSKTSEVACLRRIYLAASGLPATLCVCSIAC